MSLGVDHKTHSNPQKTIMCYVQVGFHLGFFLFFFFCGALRDHSITVGHTFCIVFCPWWIFHRLDSVDKLTWHKRITFEKNCYVSCLCWIMSKLKWKNLLCVSQSLIESIIQQKIPWLQHFTLSLGTQEAVNMRWSRTGSCHNVNTVHCHQKNHNKKEPLASHVHQEIPWKKAVAHTLVMIEADTLH